MIRTLVFAGLVAIWLGGPLLFSIWAYHQPTDPRRHRGW